MKRLDRSLCRYFRQHYISGSAITAKTAKLNKKLKMIDLQLKKAQLDQKEASRDKEIEATPIGEGRELDRNDLLKMLAAKST